MKLTAISVTYGRKLDLGGYNSVHSSITLWTNLEDGDDEASAANNIRQMARNQVMTELARNKPKLAAKVEDIFLGLPVTVQKEIKDAN